MEPPFRVQNVLAPTSQEGEDWIHGVPWDDVLKATITRPRNKRHHDKLFACAALVADNLDFDVSARQIVAGYQQYAGLGDTVKFATGTLFTPQSIAFDAMSQDTFDTFYTGFMQWVCTKVIPGLQRGHLDIEVENRLLEFAN